MGRKHHENQYLVHLRRGYARSKCQADYRGEGWKLTFEDWQEFWPPDLWARRGRHPGCLCLTRRNPDLPWSRANCCRMDRTDAIKIGRCYQAGRPVDEKLWVSAVFLD